MSTSYLNGVAVSPAEREMREAFAAISKRLDAHRVALDALVKRIEELEKRPPGDTHHHTHYSYGPAFAPEPAVPARPWVPGRPWSPPHEVTCGGTGTPAEVLSACSRSSSESSEPLGVLRATVTGYEATPPSGKQPA